MQPANRNTDFAEQDMLAWQAYRKKPSAANRQALLDRFSGVINANVNKWAGPVPRDVLSNEAKMLAVGAFDSYDPKAGAALATHLTNQLMPLSRTVYTYQNAARMPENVAQRVSALSAAQNDIKLTTGRDATLDELHDALGWDKHEINRVGSYNHRDLVESGPAVSGDFYRADQDDEDDMILGGIYMSLTPDEKRLFDHTTGYNGNAVLANPELCKKLGITQSQLSYRKKLLADKIDRIMNAPGMKKRFS